MFGYHIVTKISSTDFDKPQSTNRKNFSNWYNCDEEKPNWSMEHSMWGDFDEGLTLETVVLLRNSSQRPIFIINSVNKTRLSCHTLTVLGHSLSYGWQNSKSFLYNVGFHFPYWALRTLRLVKKSSKNSRHKSS